MSTCMIDLCSRILREYYGETVSKVGVTLTKKASSPMKVVAQDTGLKFEQVKKALCTLIQHRLVKFSQNKRGFIEYSLVPERVVLMVRYSKFIYCAKTLYGDAAELLVEELLQHGEMTMSKLVTKVTERLNEALEGNETVSPSLVKDKFTKLVHTHFIERCPGIQEGENEQEDPMPNLSIKTEMLYVVPNIHIPDSDSKKRKRSESDEQSESSKRQRTGSKDQTQDEPDAGIYWMINFERFHQHFRDQTIISAVAKKTDKKMAEVVRAMLRISEVKTEKGATETVPISVHEIHQGIPKDFDIGRRHTEQILKLLSEDSAGFVTRVGDSGGGMYVINLQTSITSICNAHIESVVQERFGSKCFRLFRLLMMKKHLEQKQIEEFAMIPSKEAKDMLYRMYAENFIHLTEVPKTPDHAPSRTYYLFSVDVNQVSRMLLERSFKAMSNIISRRECETKEHKRLLEKQQRVEAITASLEQSGADASQKEEIEEMITPPERAQLAKVKHMTNKLDESELQLDDTIFSLQLYLQYAHMR